MLVDPASTSPYGNLSAYKLYTRPTAMRLFGSYSYRRKSIAKHHENVQKMLRILALNGPLTTWGMAKTQLVDDDTDNIRSKEKKYRRLLVGRKERGKKTQGVLDIGLVVKDGKNHLRGPSDIYRLSPHGILYCLDVLDLSNKEIDNLASRYSNVLPWVFGKWQYLKSIITDEVYRIKILASGIFLDNIQVTSISNFPIYEIMTYISVKYQNNFEFIEEKDLGDQISYWFYTHLLVSSKSLQKKANKKGSLPLPYSSVEIKKWKRIFSGDKELWDWYNRFLGSAIKFYENRFKVIKYLNGV